MLQHDTQFERGRPIASAIETHWTRCLHYDLMGTSGDPRPLPTGAPGPGEGKVADVRLRAADGYPIAATRYAADGAVRGHVVVAGAVGVPQRFYRRFAAFAASHGYSTMTLDFRGVGRSAPRSLDGFAMDYFDWGRLDLAAAVSAMAGTDVPLYVMGHSFGGHTFGVLPNHDRVTAFFTFGTGAGWHGWMPRLERLKVLAMWHIVGPLLTRWKGYLAWSLLGMGEDLPLDFYRRWKQWCRYPRYFFDDPAMRHVVRSFRQVRAPLMAANSIDDLWALPDSRDAFIAGYENAPWQTLDIDPAHFGLRSIGHLGYFKPDAQPLWETALAWFERNRRDRTAAASKRPSLQPRQPAFA